MDVYSITRKLLLCIKRVKFFISKLILISVYYKRYTTLKTLKQAKLLKKLIKSLSDLNEN